MVARKMIQSPLGSQFSSHIFEVKLVYFMPFLDHPESRGLLQSLEVCYVFTMLCNDQKYIYF